MQVSSPKAGLLGSTRRDPAGNLARPRPPALTTALKVQVSRAAKAAKREDEIVYGVGGCTKVLEVWLMDKPEK